MNTEDRPDPDALVRRAAREQEGRGKLRVFFGFAPGVGKTYRMLQVARDLVSEQKIDLVVGIVETHRRYDTAALVLGLELLPRQSVEYRGKTLEEFDLDAALARKPKVILVDELAHSNAPGSRHARRWQDVEELLDAGIDVFTTLNVQHIESLNDVIAQITQVRVRETVPDAVLDRATVIELVDISPDELLERLREGKVYLPDQAHRAIEHFFQRGNLLALRELALRRTAQRVDDEVLEYRAQHGVSAPWPASERILVAVGPAPSSDRLLRSAARMAKGLRCPWVAAYVERAGPAGLSLGDADKARLEAHLRLAESLGATVARLSGTSVADALLSFARKQNVTRIVLGKPTHSRLFDRVRGSMLDEVVRGSGAIDVHVIRGDEGAREPDRVDPEAREVASIQGYSAAVAAVVAALLVAAGVRSITAAPDVEMLFLLAVMVCGVWLGRGPSLLAAALSVASYDFFFVPPYYTLSVADRRYFLTFAMMFGVGLAMSELASRLRRQERDARSWGERTAALYSLTKALASLDDESQIARVCVTQAAALFDGVALLLRPTDGGLSLVASHPEEPSLEAALGDDMAVARWAFDHGAVAGLGTDTLPGARSVCAALRVGELSLGVLVVRPRDRAPLSAEQRAMLSLFCQQISVSLERVRLAELARTAALKAETEEIRSSVLSTVSHDLRTPLAAITGAATTLRDEDALSREVRAELLDSICAESERLARLVRNLLDMTRLESGGLSLAREWVPVDELIGSALTRLEPRLRGRAVRTALPSEPPWVSVDPVLFEQLLVNLLENADKYTPAGSAIELGVTIDSSDDGNGDSAAEPTVTIEVADHGPGIVAGDEEKIFAKFYRGARDDGAGAGLGLAICRGIAMAHGGSIESANRPEGGAVFRVRLRHARLGPPDTIEPSDGRAEPTLAS